MSDETNATNHYEIRHAKRLVDIVKLRERVGIITSERDAAKTERDRIIAENAELKIKADTSVSARRVQELEGKLRDVEHRKSFDRLAKSKGANEAGLDDLWTLSGYKAERDEVDETALTALIEEQKMKRGYLFGTTAPPANGKQEPKPAPGSGQGGAGSAIPPIMDDNDPRRSDIKYLWSTFADRSAAAMERIKRGEL